MVTSLLRRFRFLNFQADPPLYPQILIRIKFAIYSVAHSTSQILHCSLQLHFYANYHSAGWQRNSLATELSRLPKASLSGGTGLTTKQFRQGKLRARKCSGKERFGGQMILVRASDLVRGRAGNKYPHAIRLIQKNDLGRSVPQAAKFRRNGVCHLFIMNGHTANKRHPVTGYDIASAAWQTKDVLIIHSLEVLLLIP